MLHVRCLSCARVFFLLVILKGRGRWIFSDTPPAPRGCAPRRLSWPLGARLARFRAGPPSAAPLGLGPASQPAALRLSVLLVGPAAWVGLVGFRSGRRLRGPLPCGSGPASPAFGLGFGFRSPLPWSPPMGALPSLFSFGSRCLFEPRLGGFQPRRDSASLLKARSQTGPLSGVC